MALFAIRELSLRQRLLLLTMVTSGIGVLFGCFSFLFYDSHAARQQKVEELQSTADLIGTNSTAALVFGDASGGSKLLEALGTRPRIRAGILYLPEGALFASFIRTDIQGTFHVPVRPPQGMVWKKDSLTLSSPVSLHGRLIGTLYLESGLLDLKQRQRLFEQLTLAIAMGCLLLVYILTAALQRGITSRFRLWRLSRDRLRTSESIHCGLPLWRERNSASSARTSTTCWNRLSAAMRR
jgi:hypothetical protein